MHVFAANWSSTKEPKIYNEEKIVSSINGVGEIEYTHADEWN